MESALTENYRLLARYNRWINQHLYDAVKVLSDEERKRNLYGQTAANTAARIVK